VESSVAPGKWCFIMKISQWRNVWDSKASCTVRLSVHFRIASILLRQIEFCRFVVRFLQYADDVAVYASHVGMENVQRTIQSACASLNKFFRDIELTVLVVLGKQVECLLRRCRRFLWL
jgi:hypothetical protein